MIGGATSHYIAGLLMVPAVCYLVFFQARLYDLNALIDATKTVRAIAERWTLVFALLVALAILLHEPRHYSWLWLLGLYGCGLVGLAAGRAVVATIMRRWIACGYHTQTVAIVGGNDLAEQLISRLEANPFGIWILGVFDEGQRDNITNIRGVPKLGGIDDLVEYAKQDLVDTVIITLPTAAKARIKAVIRKLRQHPVSIRLLPGSIGLERISPLRLARTEVPGMQLIIVGDRPISELALFVKGALDRVGASLGLILLAPILLGCVIGIAISSPGPVLFRQKRIGYREREFDIFKFRTMHAVDQPEKHLTQKNDPRVFKFGSLLRKTSLDELPQLLNVLKGDMSLVGPRPHMPEARAAGLLYFKAVNDYADRHRVKPGITGWAQVNGWRGPTETIEQIERRVEHDVYYIENWSLMFDCIIIVETIFFGFSGKNAF
jgi:Undecaprenyl-phosphate glucose phosphotransferase